MGSKKPLLLFVLFVAVSCSLSESQKNSLVSLYDAAGGSSWTNKWDTSTDPCDALWFGVACDSSHAAVTSLNLNNNSLIGSLPDLNLPFLTSL